MRLTDAELDIRFRELNGGRLPDGGTWAELAALLQAEAVDTPHRGVRAIPSMKGLYLIIATSRLSTGAKRQIRRFRFCTDAEEANEIRELLKANLRHGLRVFEPSLGTKDYRIRRSLGAVWNMVL